MEIVYVIEDFSIKGGAERIIAEKANYLASRFQHHVTIVSIYHDERPISYHLEESVDFISLEIPFTPKNHSILLKTLFRIITIGKIIFKFQTIINRIQPKLIFYTMSLGAILLPLIKTKAKKVYESHSARSFTPYHKLFFLMEKAADQVVCLTKGDAKEYKHTKKISIIPNFINTPHKLVENYDTKRVIAVGRLEYAKGFDVLIECWKKVAKKYPNWQLHIYGEGSCYEQLQQQINFLNLKEQILLCGRTDNIWDIYPNYSIQVIPSRYEGQPITLIEGQACGIPTVAFDFKYGAKDIITNGYNGFLIPQGDKNKFSEAIIQMISSENLRQKFGIHAIKVGKQYYREQIFSKWVKLIEQLYNTYVST